MTTAHFDDPGDLPYDERWDEDTPTGSADDVVPAGGWLCPAPVNNLAVGGRAGICLAALPCDDHNVHDHIDGTALYGNAYWRRADGSDGPLPAGVVPQITPDAVRRAAAVLYSTPVSSLLTRRSRWRRAVKRFSRKQIRAAEAEAVTLAQKVLAAAVAAPILPTGQISDGSHTFDELYEHRYALSCALAIAHADMAWRTRRHHPDGRDIYPGTFLLCIDTPAGPVDYHLPLAWWPLLGGIRELGHAPRYDGHTPSDVVQTIRRWFLGDDRARET